MTKFGCPCCTTMLCGEKEAWWREDGAGGSARISDDGFAPREVAMVDTVPGGTTSTETIAVGGHASVTIDTLGDRDWYRVELVAGQTYTIHTSAISGSNPDAFLNLRSDTGTIILSDDDTGDGTHSLISYAPSANGTFFIDAGTYNNTSTGSYRLSVSTFPADTTDIAETTATAAAITVGGGVNGTLDVSGDRDWHRIDLVAGETYLFRTGSTTNQTNVDTILTLRDAAGAQLATNDDSGEFAYSSVRFTATTTGAYYLDVSGFGSATGQYNLTAFTTAPLTLYTNDQIANQLTNGYWGGTSRRWGVTAGGTINYNVTALSAEGQTLAREAYALWSDVTGINFTEVTTGGQITHADNQTGAFANSSISAGTIVSSTVNVGTAWLTTYGTGLNSYSFQTYIHEIGHAIGLGHGGNYNGNADYASDALYLNDSWATTVMSYFSQTENSYFSGLGFTRQFAVSPMLADALATTVLYGTATTTRTGNTSYGFNNNSGRAIYDAAANPNVSYTVFDNGGTDTLDYSGFTQTQRIDLNAEAFSNVGGRVGNVSIGRGVVIENAVGGSGNDTVIGNGVANQIDLTHGGVDTVSAGGGDDVIILGTTLTASDSIDGGTGNDQLGISGNYTGGTALTLGAATLTNIEVLALLPGAGNSYAVTANNGTVAAGVEMTIFAGNLGAGQNFTFDGSAETDGFFRTFGGLGTDTITGSALSDGFYFGPDKWQAGDVVVGGGGTNDQLALDGNYTLTIGASADVEVLVLLAGATPNTFNITLADAWTAAGTGKTVFGRNVTTALTINGAAETGGNITIFGGRASDTLTTGSGNDIIYGLEGNDIINGGAGTGDIVSYQGTRATYSVVTGGGNVQIVDNDAVTDGNDGTDTVVGIEFARFSDQSITITSPIILDLDGGGVETLAAAHSAASFDMDGDGIGDDTSWFGKGEGLLFLDRDANGTVTNAGEFSFTGDVVGARSDLEGLAAFDSNGDGQLSKADARFADFKIWQDRDGDGVVDRREILTLKKAGVRSLNLAGTAHSATTSLGDVAIVNHGSFTRTNGRQAGFIDAVLTGLSSKDSTTHPGAAALDRGLFTGSFADAVAQLSPTASDTTREQQAMPTLTASEPDAGDIARSSATPLSVIDDYGNWMKPDGATSLDHRIALMAQDMASFGAGSTSAAADRWRRDGTAQAELFAA